MDATLDLLGSRAPEPQTLCVWRMQGPSKVIVAMILADTRFVASVRRFGTV